MKQILLCAAVAASIVLSGCKFIVDHDEDGGETSAPTHSAAPVKAAAAPLKWLEGCWQTADGGGREVWTLAGASHAFGSSVVMGTGADKDKVLFFEQMRIDSKDSAFVFHAYPAGVGPSSFPLESSGQREMTFANGVHDYPQRITYARDGKRLTARISMMDGSKPNDWVFEACD